MASAVFTPVTLIDQVTEVEAINGKVFLTFSSFGHLIRLNLDPCLTAPLSHSLRLATGDAIKQRQRDNVVTFPAKQGKKRRVA